MTKPSTASAPPAGSMIRPAVFKSLPAPGEVGLEQCDEWDSEYVTAPPATTPSPRIPTANQCPCPEPEPPPAGAAAANEFGGAGRETETVARIAVSTARRSALRHTRRSGESPRNRLARISL